MIGKSSQVIYCLSHPIQYFSPLLKKLAEKTALKVVYYADASHKQDKGFGQKIAWDTDLLEGYDYTFLKNYSWHAGLDNRFLDTINPGIFGALRKEKARVVIVNGWTYSTTLLTILFSKVLGKKVWLRAENPYNQEIRKSKKVLAVKKLFLRDVLFKFFVDRFLYIGSQSRDFFRFYGVKDAQLIYTPYSVDNDYFSSAYENLKVDLPAIKRQLKLPEDRKIILFSGKYIEKKRPMDLLNAFWPLENQGYALVMVGEGELRRAMEEFIAAKKLNHVYLTGFVNQSEIPKYYAIADVFVMCSGQGETWGLSVNEAMNFNNALVVSDTCGCCTDLVKEGQNGYSFPEGNIDELTDRIRRIFEEKDFVSLSGRRNRELVREFSIGQIVEHLEDALNSRPV